jgi:hypothetical protein
MTTFKTRPARRWWVPAVTALGCVATADEPTPTGTARQPIGGIEGTLEYALDAPWRVEPLVLTNGATTTTSYGAIPIQMTIHDADRVSDDVAFVDRVAGRLPAIGDVCDLTITERLQGGGTAVTVVPAAGFTEVERTLGAWRYAPSAQPDGPVRQRCEGGSTGACDGLRGVGGTSEWHGLSLYTARATTPGVAVWLTLDLRVTRAPGAACAGASPSQVYTLRNHVSVRLGDAPLPRFAGGWAYGDLHYHSQGTDNEGESGYNYRGVSRAMKALGIDFLWATEHASSSEQFVDVDASLGLNPDDLDVRATRGVLRDMDARRFRVLRGVVAETNAATAWRQERSFFGTTGNVPQIYLGGELDAIPETRTPRDAPIPYGADRTWSVAELCGGWRGEIAYCSSGVTSRTCEVNVWCGGVGAGCSSCDTNRLWDFVGGDTHLLRDVQGLNDLEHAREHMVYMPDPDAPAGVDPFVPSFTGTYGGARRRLTVSRLIDADAAHPSLVVPGVLTEVEQKRGSVFLAHHLNHSSGGNGPGSPPWSPSMLDAAWRSPAVIGLEFWNENARRYSPVVTGDPWSTALGVETGYQRDDVQWTTPLQLVDDGRRSLRWGSDGRFELYPYNIAQGAYYRASFGVEETLTDGSVSWDRMNLRGLDPRETASLPWLAAGQPRRMFMAGGSDGHGDFNYRREGYMTGTTQVNDTALASPRNLVFAGPPAEVATRSTSVYGARQVLGALRAGRFAVTDGPALRVVYDTNRNGVVDAGEPLMGDVVDLPQHQSLPLLVEWASTPEFGHVDQIELVLGAHSTATGQSRLYTGGKGTRLAGAAPTGSYTTNGWTYGRVENDYWHVYPQDFAQYATGDLVASINYPPQTNVSHRGVQRFTLDLGVFHVAPGVRPDRVFVRAFARTRRRGGSGVSDASCNSVESADAVLGRCVRRYAFTNPLWVRAAAPLIEPPPPVLGFR